MELLELYMKEFPNFRGIEPESLGSKQYEA